MLFVLFLFLKSILSFNLDTQSTYLIKNGNGLFGYSVALHRSTTQNLVLVGSPKGESNIKEVYNPGVIYKCDVSGDASNVVQCNDMIDSFNDGGNKYYNRNGEKDFQDAFHTILAENKTGQFLGISLASSDKYIAACAHRYEHRYLAYQISYKADPPRQLVGRCILLSQDLKFEDKFQPCDNNKDSGYDSYGYCQAGTSAALFKNELLIGAPGKNKAFGGGFSYKLPNFEDITFEMNVARSSEETDDSFKTAKYMGYTTAICNMDGIAGSNEYVDESYEYIYGGPRGNQYKGEVYIYMMNFLDNIMEPYYPLDGFKYMLQGEQMGSYFGHSLTCADYNGDGYDDLIVGAPWFTDYGTSGIIPADTGRVYIYYGSYYLEDVESMKNPVKITGDQQNAAFGFSLAQAGDINNDGFQDAFIGAPYYNDGEGAVFLHLGSSSGLQTVYSQLITPQSLNVLDNVRTFGWSISGGKDMDGNGYPDVAIGAYKSNHVAFLRTLNIIDVIPELKFSNKQIKPDSNDVDVPNSDLKLPGTGLLVCLKYQGKVLNKKLMVKYKIILDSTNKYNRIYFDYENPTKYWEQSLHLDLGSAETRCSTETPIYYVNTTQDVRPIQVSIEANIEGTGQRVVLNQEIIRKSHQNITIASKCHPDSGVCKVDLRLSLPEYTYPGDNLYPTLVYGFVPEMVQIVTVENVLKEDYNYAYGVKVNLVVPKYFTYTSVVKLKNQVAGPRVTCSQNGTTVTCNIPDNGQLNEADVLSHTFGVQFAIHNITHPIDLAISGKVIPSTPSIEQQNTDNSAKIDIPVKALAELEIRGGASQSRLPFNNQYTIVNRAIGSQLIDVRHDFAVELQEDALNQYVEDITLELYWPQRLNGDRGNYLLPLANVIIPERLDVFCTPDLSQMYSSQAVSQDNDGIVIHGEEEEYYLESTKQQDVPDSLDCSLNKELCTKITCKIDKIERGAAYLNGFKITLIAQVAEATLYGTSGINITSFAHITSVQDGLVLPRIRSVKGYTELYASTSKSTNYLWIIIGSVIGGLLFLLIVVLILWKLGFFKRKKPPSVRADKVNEGPNF